MFQTLSSLTSLINEAEHAGKAAHMLMGRPLPKAEAEALTKKLKAHFGGATLVSCDDTACRIRVFCKDGCSPNEAKEHVEELHPGWIKKVEPAQMGEEVVLEAKSAASDFDGIRSVMEDSMADLHDKVEALLQLAKETGAMKLDTVKDKEGHTVFKKIEKLTKDYKGAMDKLLLQAEMMVMQVAEGQEDAGEALTEGEEDAAK